MFVTDSDSVMLCNQHSDGPVRVPLIVLPNLPITMDLAASHCRDVAAFHSFEDILETPQSSLSSHVRPFIFEVFYAHCTENWKYLGCFVEKANRCVT